MKMDISERHPSWSLGNTCLTREPAEKRITWTIPAGRFGDHLHRIRVLSRDLVDSAAGLWRASYPEIAGSPHEFLLDPNRYEALVAMEDAWEEDSRSKVYCMSVVEEIATGRVVAASVLTKFERNLQVEFSHVATHPDYHGRDLREELRLFARIIALDSGAEYFTTFCETWQDITQNRCVRNGWKIAGIFPGNCIRRNGDGEEYRGCTVHFYKFAGKGECYATKPQEWQLAPEVKEVWDAMEQVNKKTENIYRARIEKRVMRSYALSP